jgi:glutamyl-tRNA reductase
MVIGETQILGQVKDAYHTARDAGNTGTILNKLFHFAIETGKRVRAETKISDGILSISSAAVDLANKILGGLSFRTALIIGAGEMSELTARHLAAAGINKMYFANRTLENAMLMADQFGGTALLLDERKTVMAECDIIISSTGSPHFIITPEEIKRTMTARRHRALFLIDIAAPRDIHPGVGKLPNVFLYSIDDLSRVVTNNSQLRAGEIGKVRTIIEEDREKYFDWYRSLKVLPTLISLRKHFEDMRDDELNAYAAEISNLPEETQDLVRRIASSLTKRFMSNPSKVLKEVASGGDSGMYTKSIATLFDLKVPHHDK